MPHQFYVFNTPAGVPLLEGTHVTLAHDSGWGGTAVPSVDPAGRAGVVFDIPDSVPPGNGAQVNLEATGKIPLQARGVLVYADAERAYLQCDDFTLTDVPAPPEPPIPPPVTGGTPLEIINGVYASGNYNLASKTGCGTFTEECCRQLSVAFPASLWGHVAKSPGQNQYQNHAVDAVMSLAGNDNGIWDIITSSVSSSARPAFNRAGDSKPDLWRPNAPLPCAPATTTRIAVEINIDDLLMFLAAVKQPETR